MRTRVVEARGGRGRSYPLGAREVRAWLPVGGSGDAGAAAIGGLGGACKSYVLRLGEGACVVAYWRLGGAHESY
jgi:hypothetical protein